MACTYCYQIQKNHNTMPFETAKKMVDQLLNDETYINEMCTLWKNIAEHYVTSVENGGRSDLAGTILAYDLVNEPVNRHDLATGKKEWNVISSYSTPLLSKSDERINNLKIVCDRVNNYILHPNQTFSSGPA